MSNELVSAIDTAEVPVNTDQYHEKAKALVTDDFNRLYPNLRYPAVPGHFYVVAFMKVLGNWKALVSTDLINGHYWEVTYDGNKQQSYVDLYLKNRNSRVTDEGYVETTLS